MDDVFRLSRRVRSCRPLRGQDRPEIPGEPGIRPRGFVLPADEVRGFGMWFYQHKCELLAFEIGRSRKHPAEWEKKGSSLYTVTNVTRYPELRRQSSLQAADPASEILPRSESSHRWIYAGFNHPGHISTSSASGTCSKGQSGHTPPTSVISVMGRGSPCPGEGNRLLRLSIAL